MVTSSVTVDFSGVLVGLILYPLEFLLLHQKSNKIRVILLIYGLIASIVCSMIPFFPQLIFYDWTIAIAHWGWVGVLVCYLGLIAVEFFLVKYKEYVVFYWSLELDLYLDEIIQYVFVIFIIAIGIGMQMFDCSFCLTYDVQMVVILLNFGLFIAVIKDAKYRILLIILGATLSPILVLSKLIAEVKYIESSEYLPWSTYTSIWDIGYNIQVTGMCVYDIMLIIFTTLIWNEA